MRKADILRGLLGAFTLFLAVSPWVEARVQDVKVFKEAYPEAKKVTCKTCHNAAVGKADNLNAYGEALKAAAAEAEAEALTVEILKAVEAADADEDGVSNLDEIKGGTAPGEGEAAAEGSEPEANLRGEGASAPFLAGLLDAIAGGPVWAEEEEAAKAEYVGMETCVACHADVGEAFQDSFHYNVTLEADGLEIVGCESCHGPGSIHAEMGGGKGVGGLIDPNEHPETCFKCHMEKRAEFSRPYRHPVMEGKMHCSDCHDPHGSADESWAASMFEEQNALCAECHKEQTQPFVWEHEALREGCTSCHNPHGSIHEKQLVVRDNNLCLRCHAQVDHPDIGDRGHGSSFADGTCFSGGCHTAVHGSQFGDHLRY